MVSESTRKTCTAFRNQQSPHLPPTGQQPSRGENRPHVAPVPLKLEAQEARAGGKGRGETEGGQGGPRSALSTPTPQLPQLIRMNAYPPPCSLS